MKTLGIIGGTFDPIHYGHLYIAEVAIYKLKLDKVIFMPAGSPPHKENKRVTEASLRLLMVESAIKDISGFQVSNYEIEEKGKSYTYKTLEYFSTDNEEIYFIVGSDGLINFHTWEEPDKILKLCTLVVVTRPGFNKEELLKKKTYFEDKYNGKIIFLEVEGKEISSTEIRNKIKNNENIEKLLPKSVYDIINEKGLYRGGKFD